jgi:hypothetical protein
VLSSGYLSSIIQITIKSNQVNLDALCLLRKLFIELINEIKVFNKAIGSQLCAPLVYIKDQFYQVKLKLEKIGRISQNEGKTN